MDAKALTVPGIYAFVVDDVVVYVGLTQSGLKTRFDQYRLRHVTPQQNTHLSSSQVCAYRRLIIQLMNPPTMTPSRERHHGCLDGVALFSLSRIIHEFFGGITAPFYGTFHNVYALVDSLCHRRCCA